MDMPIIIVCVVHQKIAVPKSTLKTIVRDIHKYSYFFSLILILMNIPAN